MATSLICKPWEVAEILSGRITQLVRPVSKILGDILDKEKAVGSFQVYDGLLASIPEIAEDIECPFGKPGDKLWVKEPFYEDDCGGHIPEYFFVYKADDLEETHTIKIYDSAEEMPRRASRLTLEVLSVRVERLHKSGLVEPLYVPEWTRSENPPELILDGGVRVPNFRELAIRRERWRKDLERQCHHQKMTMSQWNTEYPETPWESNPWVFVGEVRKVEV
jgi:hypothetical protein